MTSIPCFPGDMLCVPSHALTEKKNCLPDNTMCDVSKVEHELPTSLSTCQGGSRLGRKTCAAPVCPVCGAQQKALAADNLASECFIVNTLSTPPCGYRVLVRWLLRRVGSLDVGPAHEAHAPLVLGSFEMHPLLPLYLSYMISEP